MQRYSRSRRGFLIGSSLVTGALALSRTATAQTQAPIPSLPNAPLDDIARDEAYWGKVQAHYSLTDNVTNLENGYWGVMAEPVLHAYKKHTDFINKQNTYFARREWGGTYQSIREKTAKFLNVDTDEIVISRGATEALQALIAGYKNLKPGDAVLYADLDYSEMKNAFRWLEERRGVKVIKINFPEPANWENVTEMYRRAFEAHPNIKLMLMTHLNNWTGLISPVKTVAKMAKERGIDIILDAAHSVGHVDFDIRDLGCDFVGVNLHKWVGAPIGAGVMYVKKDRIKDIDTYMGRDPESKEITARMDTGTVNFAAYMAIPDAINFHNQIGTKAKQARVTYLRNLWVNEVRNTDGIEILTPDDPRMVAALTSFRLKNELSTEGNNAISRTLAEKYGVLTVRRTGPAKGDCVRVTPSVYNTPNDVLKLAAALKKMV